MTASREVPILTAKQAEAMSEQKVPLLTARAWLCARMHPNFDVTR